MRRDQQGVALIELLVAIVIFAILFLIIDAVFISAHRGARKAEVGADVNQNARVAVERLIGEIRESSVILESDAPGIQVKPGGTAVIFPSARPSDASSSFCLNWGSNPELAAANLGCPNPAPSATYAPVWQRWIAYYFDTSPPECEVGIGKPGGCVRRIDAWDPALGFPSSGGQVIATAVESFAVTPVCATPSCWGSPATLTVTLKGRGQEVVQGSNVPPQEIVLKATTVIRN